MADDSGFSWLNFTNSPWATGGAAALGGLGDIWSFIQQLQMMNLIRNPAQILQDPSKLAAGAGALLPQMSPQAMSLFNRGVDADYAVNTGGAPGGALNQAKSDAWAKLVADMYQRAVGQYIGSLQGAGQTASRLPQQGIGALGGVLNQLKQLQALRGGQSPGITYDPNPSGLTQANLEGSFPSPVPMNNTVGGAYE